MGGNSSGSRYLQAGSVLGQVTRARAGEMLREMVDAGEAQREQLERWVDDVVEFLERFCQRAAGATLGVLRTMLDDRPADRGGPGSGPAPAQPTSSEAGESPAATGSGS